MNFSYNDFIESTPKAIITLLSFKNETMTGQAISNTRDIEGNILTPEQLALCKRFNVSPSEISFIDSNNI